jgi:hypothetical protein
MLAVIAAVALAQAGVEGRGEAKTPPVSEEARLKLRDRLGFGLVGGGGFGGGAIGAGGGFSLEGGLIFNDRVSVGLRFSLMTIIFVLDLRLALTVDYALSDHVSLGTGLGGMLLAGLQPLSAFNLVVPLRVTFAPLARAPDKVSRSSLIFGFEVAPGVVALPIANVAGTRPSTLFAIGGQLTIGWAWW